jgi:D-aminopeptidase
VTRLTTLAFLLLAPALLASQSPRRARAIGVAPGVYPPGPVNAITDVAGVLVGQRTIVIGDSIRTGVTAILPHGENPYFLRVPAAILVGNGFGKLAGSTQVNELGELETPILLTCTLCTWKAADALAAWMLARSGMEAVRSINPVVGETNDGTLNAIRSRPVSAEDVRAALDSARPGPVLEGSVGAGTGTIAFGWKAGIGTSSRVLPARSGGWTIGVLVQSNFGGVLQVLGVPVGQELDRRAARAPSGHGADGSIIIVVATDAPLGDRNLRRLAERALLGMGRTGGSMSNGSGDYVIAFSAAPAVLRRLTPEGERQSAPSGPELGNDAMSPLFQAVIEATEEAIYNSLFMATPVTSRGRTVAPLPMDKVVQILQKFGVATR